MEARKEGPFAPEVMPPFMRGEGPQDYKWPVQLISALVGLILDLFYEVKVEGLANLPIGSGYVLAPNHDNEIDPVMLAKLYLDRGKPIYWLAKIELFQGFGILGKGSKVRIGAKQAMKFMYMVHGIPVTRGNAEPVSITAACSLLEAGEVVVVFPEGTRNKDGRKDTAEDLKGGAPVLARRAKVPLVPQSLKSTSPTLWPLRRGTLPSSTVHRFRLRRSGRQSNCSLNCSTK